MLKGPRGGNISHSRQASQSPQITRINRSTTSNKAQNIPLKRFSTIKSLNNTTSTHQSQTARHKQDDNPNLPPYAQLSTIDISSWYVHRGLVDNHYSNNISSQVNSSSASSASSSRDNAPNLNHHVFPKDSILRTLHTPLTPEQENVIIQFKNAIQNNGFFYITGSPLHHHINDMQSISSWYFNQSDHIKLQSQTYNTRRGYHHFLGTPHTISIDNLSTRDNTNNNDNMKVHDHSRVPSSSSLQSSSDHHNNTSQSNSSLLKHANYDKIEAFTMQSPYFTDKMLLKKYQGDIDSDNSDNNDNNSTNNQDYAVPISSNPSSSDIKPAACLGVALPNNPRLRALLEQQQKQQQQQQLNDNNISLRPYSPSRKIITQDTNRWPLSSAPPQGSSSPQGSSLLFNNNTHDNDSNNNNHHNSLLFKNRYIQYYNSSIYTSMILLSILSHCLQIEPEILLSLHTSDNHTLETKQYPPLSKIQLSDTAITAPSSTQQQHDDKRQNSPEINVNTNNTNNTTTNNNNNNLLASLRLRFPQHSDLSTLTLLTQTHDNGGLLIKTHDYNDTIYNGWKRAEHHYYTSILVNIGDYLQDMTGYILESTQHCVAQLNNNNNNNSGIKTINTNNPNITTTTTSISSPQDNHNNNNIDTTTIPRISTVFFYQPDMDATIRNYASHIPHSQSIIPYEAGDRIPFIM